MAQGDGEDSKTVGEGDASFPSSPVAPVAPVAAGTANASTESMSRSAADRTPPTQRGQVSVAPPSPRWPTALGVIAIVYASLGLADLACGALGWILTWFMPESMFAELLDPLPSASGLQRALTMLVSLGLSLWLIWLGIGFLKRRAGLPRPVRIWSLAAMAFAVLQAYEVWRLQMDSTASGPSAGTSGFANEIGQVMAWTTAGLTLAWGWLMPVILLLWCHLPKCRAQMMDWSGATAAVARETAPARFAPASGAFEAGEAPERRENR